MVLDSPLPSSEKLFASSASTGGNKAIRYVLEPVPVTSPTLLITQHMHANANQLNKHCQIAVKEAEEGERILPGHAYIAPAAHHMKLARGGANYLIRLHDGSPVNHHGGRTVPFRGEIRRTQPRWRHSDRYGGGASGLLAMLQIGAWTLARKMICVVYACHARR